VPESRARSESPEASPAPRRVPVLWTFRTGATVLASAGLGAEGDVSVGTSDGYVHRLRPDGSYQWSYTLQGAVRSPPVAGDRGLTFVATRTDKVYALRPDGTLAWAFSAVFGIESDLVLGPNGHLYFMGRDHHLYGLSQRGGVMLRVRAGEPSAGPIAAQGSVWLGTRTGDVVTSTGLMTRRFSASSAALQSLVEGPDGRLYALGGGKLFALGAAGKGGAEAADLGGASRLIAASSAMVVVTDDNEALWLDAEQRVLARVGLGEPPSAAPLAHPDGRLLVPTASGALVVADPHSGRVEHIAVAASPLLDLVWDAPRKRALATASEGLVAAVAPDP
jgi:hypothetical protein